MSQIPTPVYDADFFRLSDLYLSPNDLLVIPGDEFDQILSTELNLGDGGGDAGSFDDSDSNDDYFSVTAPAPARPVQVALQAHHDGNRGHLVNLADDSSSTENDAWIDRALVITAAAAPLALSTRPKSWFGKLADTFSRRNKN